MTGQKDGSVAIGYNAGTDFLGTNSIAIGAYSGFTGSNNSIQISSSGVTSAYQGNNSIILNATLVGITGPEGSIILGAGSAIIGATALNGFYVAPINGTTGIVYPNNIMGYNTTSKEITYNTFTGVSATSGFNVSTTTSFSVNNTVYTSYTFNGLTGSIGFSSPVNATMKVLLVGGGGGGGGGGAGAGGGSRAGGGGGGGQVLYLSNIPISSGTTYNIINGIGGEAGVASIAALNGADTSLTSLGIGITYISKGGGAGGTNGVAIVNAPLGLIGTSSAGGCFTPATVTGGGIGSIAFNGDPAFFVYNTYAHNGGNGFSNNNSGAGGGGGGGGEGFNGTLTTGGNGGAGVYINMNNSLIEYGGGGGGGCNSSTVGSLGGLGSNGGGNGASSVAPQILATEGKPNTGTGGGGGANALTGSTGGSGLTIITVLSSYF